METPDQIKLTQPRGTILINMGVAALIIAGLYFGREIFVPVALAVLLSFVLAPFVRRLQALRLPRVAAVLLVVIVVLESVDFCVTSGDGADPPGDASAPGAGVVSVVFVVVVVSFVVPLHPTNIVPAMKANAATAVNETIHFEIFMGRAYQ